MNTQAGPLQLRGMEGTYASGEYLSLMTLGCGPLGKEGKVGSCGQKADWRVRLGESRRGPGGRLA